MTQGKRIAQATTWWLRMLVMIIIAQCFLPALADDYERSRRFDMLFTEAMMQRQKGNAAAQFDLLQRCIELRPDAAEPYYYLAQCYGEMRLDDRAFVCFKKAAELAPDNTTYMETLAQSYIQREQYAEAIPVVERIYEADKSKSNLLEMLYRLHIQERNFDKAVEVLDKMEAIDGKSEQLSLMKSNLFIQKDDKAAAIREMKALSEQFPNDLNYRTLYAQMLLMDDQKELAQKILSQVLTEEPQNYRAQSVLRSYYISEQDSLRADSLTRSLLLNSQTVLENKVALLRQEIGYSENNGGDSTRVLSLFRDMLVQPDADSDIAELCAAYMHLKKMPRDSVAAKLEQALALAPDKASARLQLVQYAWEEENNQRVVMLCQDARQYNPDEMAFYYYQGMAYYRMDDYDNALGAFQNGVSVINDESNPAIVSDFYAVMGDLLHQKGQQREAFEAYDSCLQWKPDNIGCLNNYAYYLSELDLRLSDAEEMSFRVIKEEPKNPTYLDTYAWILFKQKRYSEARIYIDQALQNDTTVNAVITEHAGDIYALNGDMEGALRLWQQALEKDPDNKTLIRKIKRKKYIVKR